jgi:hypothetical protein
LKFKDFKNSIEHETWFEHTRSGIKVRHLIRDDSGNEQTLTGTNKNPGPEPLAMAKIEKLNPHRRSSLEDSLKAQGIYEEVMALPKIKKAIGDLGESIQAGEREAFTAGWNAFLATHSGLLIAHGIKDFRIGFESAWEKYWQSRKE